MKEQKVLRSYKDILKDVESGRDLDIVFLQQNILPDHIRKMPFNPVRKSLLDHLVRKGNVKGLTSNEAINLMDNWTVFNFVMVKGIITKIIRAVECDNIPIRPGCDNCYHMTEETENEESVISGAVVSKNFTKKTKLYHRVRKRLV